MTIIEKYSVRRRENCGTCRGYIHEPFLVYCKSPLFFGCLQSYILSEHHKCWSRNTALIRYSKALCSIIMFSFIFCSDRTFRQVWQVRWNRPLFAITWLLLKSLESSNCPDVWEFWLSFNMIQLYTALLIDWLIHSTNSCREYVCNPNA